MDKISPTESQDQLMTSSYHEINHEDSTFLGLGNASTDVGIGPTSQTIPLNDSGSGSGSFENIDSAARKFFDKARNWVGELEGYVAQEGSQLTYVTQDLTQKIKLASPTKESVGLDPGRNPIYQETVHVRKPKKLSFAPDSSLSISMTGSLDLEGQGPPSSSLPMDDLNVVINEIELEAKKLASSVDTLTENLSGILHSLSSMTVDCTFVASDGVTQLCDTADASIKVMYQVMAKTEELNRTIQPIYHLHQQIKDTKRLLDKVESEV